MMMALTFGQFDAVAFYVVNSAKPADVRQIGTLGSTIRLSMGLEHPADLIADISQALDAQ